MKDRYSEYALAESIRRTRARINSSRDGMLRTQRAQAEDGFTCKHCGVFVSSAAFLSGVLNRNHCPYCLWSRHVDLCQAGDRLAACKAPMRPVGLALKRTAKKYAGMQSGELMLVHLCTGCASLSINRIAADDDPDLLLEVFEHSQRSDPLADSVQSGQPVQLLGKEDWALVGARLFGG